MGEEEKDNTYSGQMSLETEVVMEEKRGVAEREEDTVLTPALGERMHPPVPLNSRDSNCCAVPRRVT